MIETLSRWPYVWPLALCLAPLVAFLFIWAACVVGAGADHELERIARAIKAGNDDK